MRLLALVLFGLPLAVATLVEARRGNPVAIGIALGVVGPLLFMAAVVALTRILASLAPKAVARKADPAKIARLERELLDEPPEPPASEAPTGKLPMVLYEGTMREALAIRRATFGRKIEGP